MARSVKSKLFVHIKVLQSGTTLASVEKQMKRESLKLQSSGSGPLVLPHYSLPNNNYEFLICSKTCAKLVIEHSWEGFATSKGNLKQVTRQEKGQSVIEMSKGDYASITHNDLRIMVKITNEMPKAEKKQRLFISQSYKGSLTSLLVGSRIERPAMAGAFVISAIIVGGFAIGLLKRPFFKPQNLADVRPEFAMPFVHPEHFITAPEAMQINYNRLNPVRSVINYYSAVTDDLIGGKIEHPELLFASSIARSREQHEAVRGELDEYRKKQREVQDHVKQRGGAAMLAIPAVTGETMVGSMRRVIDKVNIMHEHYRLSLAERRAVTETFPRQREYTFDDYKSEGAGSEALKKFGQSVSSAFNPESSESVMYKEASLLGKSAELAQLQMKPAVTEFREPIRFAHGGSFATFLSDIDFAYLDDRLKTMEGAPYSDKPRPKSEAAPAPRVGTIAPALVEKFINQHKFQLQICYEQSLRRNDGSIGEMEWRWTITPRGTVTGIELARSTIKDKKLEACIKEKMKSWQFPSPDRGSVEISYPFVFSPNKG
jgi:hypothetical protein